MTLLVVTLLSPLLLLALSLAATPVRVLAWLAAVGSAVQLGLCAWLAWPVLASGAELAPWHRLRVDGAAAWFLVLTALVAAASLTHAIGFFQREASGPHPPTPRAVRQFYGFSALFVMAMQFACCADDLGMLWICIEATTLMSAPLVYYHRSQAALEATWKYLIICSVGIAFALFGTAIIFTASQQIAAVEGGSLSLATLTHHARDLPAGLLRLGFVFTLLGYGTKAGLFPIHTWLPDAHSEAPAPGSAMLSGALLNCALLGLHRLSSLLAAADLARFVTATLLPLALATVLAAALMLLRQVDLKRLLAYSSMENVGLMATAIALGNGGGFALQALNHSVVKVALFLLAGNLLQDFGSKALTDIRGLQTRRPGEALVLALAFVAIAGAPPFGSFLAEWQILSQAADAGRIGTVVVLCLGLAIAFIALIRHGAALVWGSPPESLGEPRAARGQVIVPVAMVIVALGLGLALAPWLLAVAQGVA